MYKLGSNRQEFLFNYFPTRRNACSNELVSDSKETQKIWILAFARMTHFIIFLLLRQPLIIFDTKLHLHKLFNLVTNFDKINS